MERKDVILKLIEVSNKVNMIKADRKNSIAMKRIALKVCRNELIELNNTLKEGEENESKNISL